MNKTVTYIGGYPAVRAAGYRFNRNEPVELPAEIADALLNPQQDDNPASMTEPLFALEADAQDPVQPE